MTKQKILTDICQDAENQIPKFCEKWRSIQVLTQPIDRARVTEIIKNTYKSIERVEPEILFYDNPLQAIKAIINAEDFQSYLGRDVSGKFSKKIFGHLQNIILRQFDDRLSIKLSNQILTAQVSYDLGKCLQLPRYFPVNILQCLQRQLITDLERLNLELVGADISYFTRHILRPADWAVWGCQFDFCISVLKLSYDRPKWELLQHLICETGFLFLYEKVCFACDRPSILKFDRDNFLHAEGQPALQFADGYSVYASHGKYISNS